MRISLSVLIMLCLTSSIFPQHSSVFPEPKEIQITGSDFRFQGPLLLEANEQSREVYDYFHAVFEKDHQIHFELSSVKQAHVRLTQIQTFVYSEGYALKTSPAGVEIQYSSRESLIHALHTLNQLVENSNTITGVEIQDFPAFPYRGMHLDCSRHFFTIPELEGLIDQLAKLKYNRFHWHLTDDQGWRIEIKKYPKLTEVGAWRDSTLIGHFSKQPTEYKKERYGGFYTQEEARKLVEYARIRGVEIIPEIEMPGHASAAIAAYPALSCEGKNIPVVGTWGVFDDVFCSKEFTRNFLKDVLDEVMDIFPYPVIHIGGDECPKVKWEACDACEVIRTENNLSSKFELQSFFIKDIEKHVNSKGKKIIGWDEILEGGLAPNAQVMSWQGMEGGIHAAKEKHEVVMTPTSHCYFDYYQSSHPDEPLAIGGYVPLEKVYGFNPLKGIDTVYWKYVLGAQANMWTEYLQTMNGVQYQAFPRLVAMSEVLWNKSKIPYQNFVEALSAYYIPRLKKAGIHFSSSYLDPMIQASVNKNGMSYDLVKPVSSARYSMNNQTLESFTIARTVAKQVHSFEILSAVGNQALRTCRVEYTSHLALGKKVVFKTPPHEKYNHNGEMGLTDGVVGKKPWKGSEWLGFYTDTVEFQLDLGKKTSFNRIAIGTLHDPGSWIYQPIQYQIEYSSNQKKYQLLEQKNIESEEILVERKVKTRYLRIRIVNVNKIPTGMTGAGFTPWTFINEVIITK